MSSTGEVACFHNNMHGAYLRALQSTYMKMPKAGDMLWVQVAPDPAEIPVIGVNVGNLADGVEEARVYARARLLGPVTRSRTRASPY